MRLFEKLVIILLGPPGAGKGTQATLLAEKLNLFYLETSKILEEAFEKKERKYLKIENKKYFFQKEKELWLKGILCSPPFVTELVKEKIEKLAKERKNLVLAGSPRTLYEGERIVPLLIKLYGKENIKVFLIEISQKTSIFRNSHRRICELLRHSILYNKETKNLKHCPLDGSKLLKRELDRPEIIKTRLKEYKKRTLPLVEYFKKQKLKVKKIKGEKSVAEIYKKILKELENDKNKKRNCHNERRREDFS